MSFAFPTYSFSFIFHFSDRSSYVFASLQPIPLHMGQSEHESLSHRFITVSSSSFFNNESYFSARNFSDFHLFLFTPKAFNE